MKREIIKIDKDKCNGCGVCVPNCHEGALQIIDGKAVLVSELMCDGLGACIGHCPEDAITIEEREAEAYNELVVIQRLMNESQNVMIAHLSHLKEHKEFNYLKQAVTYLKENENTLKFSLPELIEKVHNHNEKKPSVKVEAMEHKHEQHHAGCPGSLSRQIRKPDNSDNSPQTSDLRPQTSELANWPIQLHLINPGATYFNNADVLISADCVAYAAGNFHQQYLKGKTLLIACPKLDSNKEVYVEKIISLINNAGIKSITVLKMEVPCCGGLLQIAQLANQQASKQVPLECITIGINGDPK